MFAENLILNSYYTKIVLKKALVDNLSINHDTLVETRLMELIAKTEAISKIRA